MDLINEKVKHKTFGSGSVVNCDNSYIKINFESGVKKFVFPDVFKKYVKLINQEAADLVKTKIEEKEESLKEKELKLQKKNALRRERRMILRQESNKKNRKVEPELQSVFWCRNKEEEEEIFTDWKVFTGRIKSGDNKGQPRKLPRINHRSACLLTRRDPDMAEEDRQILGVFMAEETFSGKLSQDGYIPAHSKYRLRLSKEESEKLLFWNYYANKRFPERITWNSGKQRYFDNIWMAQILQDIVSLRDKDEEREEAETFLKYFCRVNHINEEEIPEADGALKRIEN